MTTTFSRGKLAVLAMFALALTMAAFAWWWNHTSTRQSLAFYGGDAAHLIRTAPQVEILVLYAPSVSAELGTDGIQFGDVSRQVLRRIDISKAPGLLNARTSLLSDASYVGRATENGEDVARVVRFADGKEQTLLGLDDPVRHAVLPDGRRLRLADKTARGWQSFIDRHVQAKPPAPAHTVPSE